MKNTNLALRRFSISVVALATVGAGLPALLSTGSASADHTAGHSAAQASATPSDTATATISPSPSDSPTATMSPSPSASASAPASSSPSVSPSASASKAPNGPPATPPGCAVAAEVMLGRDTINATGTAPLSAKAAPNVIVDVFAYTRPSIEYRLVRSGRTDENGNVTFTDVRPPANTRLKAQQRGCAFGTSKVLNVRTQLSLFAVRNGTRTYTFSGNAIPARPNGLIISLYRVQLDGREILTAQNRANANKGQAGYDPSRPAGAYSITRKFTGTGRFGFVVRTGQDLQNAPGRSNTRPTLIY